MDSELDSTNAMLKLSGSFGLDGLLQTLFDKCFILIDPQYTYEACVFGKIQQHSSGTGSKGSGTTLGEFQRMVGPLTDGSGSAEFIIEYSKGTYCYSISGGRRATMVIQCGGADELVRVSETTTCEYKLVFKSPLACTEADLDRASAEVARLGRPHAAAAPLPARGIHPNDMHRYTFDRNEPLGHFACFDGSATVDYRNAFPCGRGALTHAPRR